MCVWLCLYLDIHNKFDEEDANSNRRAITLYSDLAHTIADAVNMLDLGGMDMEILAPSLISFLTGDVTPSIHLLSAILQICVRWLDRSLLEKRELPEDVMNACLDVVKRLLHLNGTTAYIMLTYVHKHIILLFNILNLCIDKSYHPECIKFLKLQPLALASLLSDLESFIANGLKDEGNVQSSFHTRRFKIIHYYSHALQSKLAGLHLSCWSYFYPMICGICDPL